MDGRTLHDLPRWSGIVADLLRVAAAVSLVVAVVWYPVETWIRFGLLVGVLLLPRLLRLPRPFDAALCATLLLATWAGVTGWYVEIVWMDEVVHFVTVGAVSAACYLALARLGLLPGPQQLPVRARGLSITVLTASLGLAVASLWEFYEWAANQLPGESIHVGYTDTILDLVLGGAGSVVSGLAVASWAAAGLEARRQTAATPAG